MADQQNGSVTLHISHGGKGNKIRVVQELKTGKIEITDMQEPFISVTLTPWQLKEIAKFIETNGF